MYNLVSFTLFHDEKMTIITMIIIIIISIKKICLLLVIVTLTTVNNIYLLTVRGPDGEIVG